VKKEEHGTWRSAIGTWRLVFGFEYFVQVSGSKVHDPGLDSTDLYKTYCYLTKSAYFK
jgi:hypothetical protein